MRAGIYARKYLYGRALADMNAALGLEPDNAGYLHNRAVVLTGLERYGEAITDYEKAIVLNPNGGGTYNNLSWLLATAKNAAFRDCRKAILYARKALETGTNGAWLDTLAAAHAECGEFEKAVEIETRAYEFSQPPNENFKKRADLYKRGRTYAKWRFQSSQTAG